MQSLAYVLGIAEILLVPLSVILLIVALVAPSPRRARRAITFALVLAATVAQPFGIIATPVSGVPSGARVVDSTSPHVARLFGVVPLLPFALYREERLGPVSDQGPTSALKARSWFWLPILTNATRIMNICANDITVPCWETTDNGPGGPGNALSLAEKNGTYYATLLNPDGPRYLAPGSYTWELTPGIASIPGAIYWTILTILIPAVLRACRQREDSTTGARTSSTTFRPPA